MSKPIFARDGRGICKKCAKERDVIVYCAQPPWPPTIKDLDNPVMSRHLNQIEEITARGVRPEGFCPGSLGEFDPVKTPERPRGKGKR